MASIPAGLPCLITERILVPKMPLALARGSNVPSAGIGFISCTPFASASRPWSTFKIGTICLTSHRYCAVGRPRMSRSIVSSNRMAARIRSPLKAGLVMMRVRIAWMRSIISPSLDQRSSAIPYRRRAFGVLPPLWSSAAMKPGCVRILAFCCSNVFMRVLTRAVRRGSRPSYGRPGEAFSRR